MKKVAIIFILVAGVLILLRCGNSEKSVKPATYTGSDKCQSCHQHEFSLYSQSDHFHAMDTVSQSSVLGDFDNSRFIYFGDTSLFYKKNDHFFVSTKDSTGRRSEFQVSYTFGWRPLQQYLVKFTDGRIQVLPFCWDTRPKEKGGQRWFHLYNNTQNITNRDELFWMEINQNWNYMCADCHTTDFKTNFNAKANIFNSTWKIANVSCESCHGPASNHIEWTKDNAAEPYKGFAISLASKKMNWKLDSIRQIAMPESVVMNDTLVETCARCHARATKFSDHYVHGQSLLQTHIPAGIENVNYYPDGQIKEEDYEYGSFLQSKMYASGVTCINCHDPHSMKVKQTGNALCISCHAPAKFDGPQHSFHGMTSTGNQCVNCHMPVTTYMVIDDRRDHSFRIPRPDLSLAGNSPNACNKCHSDKTVKWAADNFAKWYGHKVDTSSWIQLKLYIAGLNKRSEPALFALLSDKKYPAIIRASAMDEYGMITSSRIFSRLVDALNNDDPLIRLNAIKGLINYPQQDIVSKLSPLLADKIVAVRMEAMNAIAPSYNLLLAEDQQIFKKVMTEYVRVQERMSHRPEGFYNRAILYLATGDMANAEQLYKTGIRRFPSFGPAYSNLADLYRDQKKEADAKIIIDNGLRALPGNAQLHYALGLWYIRNKENKQGINQLKIAALLDPGDAQMIYGYSVALFSGEQKKEAIALLEKYTALHGNNAMILDVLSSMYRDMNNSEKAAYYTQIRKEVFGY